MATRITETDKWNDSFFLNLNPYEKLTFIYITDNCDDAGFMDLHYDTIAPKLKMRVQELHHCINSLLKAIAVNKSGDKVWLKNYLKHQKKLPLPIKNKEGKAIFVKLNNSFEDFNRSPDIERILKAAQNKTTTEAEYDFTPPTLSDAMSWYRTTDWFRNKWLRDGDAEVENIFHHYTKVGWKTTGKTKIVDWKVAFQYCFNRNFKERHKGLTPVQWEILQKQREEDKLLKQNSNATTNTKNNFGANRTTNSKTDILQKANDNLKNIVFNKTK